MNKRIDIGGLEWITGSYGNKFQERIQDIRVVYDKVKEIDEYIEGRYRREFILEVKPSAKVIERLEEDIEYFQEHIKTEYKLLGVLESGNEARIHDNRKRAIRSVVYETIDYPFYRGMEKVIKELSEVEIGAYKTNNKIGYYEVTEKEYDAINPYGIDQPKYDIHYYGGIGIDEILNSELSRSIFESDYEAFVELLFPDIERSEEGTEERLYTIYKQSVLRRADFNYQTSADKMLNGIRSLGGWFSLGGFICLLVPGLQAGAPIFFGMATTTDVISFGIRFDTVISGKDINGITLTDVQREKEINALTVEGLMLIIDIGGTIFSWKYAKRVSEVDNYDDIITKTGKTKTEIDEFLKANNLELDDLRRQIASMDVDDIEKLFKGPEQTVGQYTETIRWGINDIEARPYGEGYFGERVQQTDPRVDAYELKINPNNESFYLKHPDGGYVQFENVVDNVAQDGKLVMQQRSFYKVDELPEFAKNKVINEATRQLAATDIVGYQVEWLVSNEDAVEQLAKLFKEKNINIVIKYFPE